MSSWHWEFWLCLGGMLFAFFVYICCFIVERLWHCITRTGNPEYRILWCWAPQQVMPLTLSTKWHFLYNKWQCSREHWRGGGWQRCANHPVTLMCTITVLRRVPLQNWPLCFLWSSQNFCYWSALPDCRMFWENCMVSCFYGVQSRQHSGKKGRGRVHHRDSCCILSRCSLLSLQPWSNLPFAKSSQVYTVKVAGVFVYVCYSSATSILVFCQ